tara:strand:- start:589 stop:1524 length:936 start_codon:yes stop_codon:yes gene_type:complete
MANKHYKEQKMLIENFRKWREEDDEQEIIQEGLLSFLTVSTAVLWTIGPYLKIAVHYPSVQKVLAGQDTKSSKMFRAMAIGLKGSDNAGQWLQNYADGLFGLVTGKDDQNGRSWPHGRSAIKQLRDAVLLLAFLSVLMATSWPMLVGAPFVRALPTATLYIRKLIAATKKKTKEISARIKGVPTEDEAAAAAAEAQKELEELESLEQEKRAAEEAAASMAEVLAIIKEDPKKAAAEYGVELSAEELKAMKIDPDPTERPKPPTSKARKVELPPKKVTPDELAARKAAADASLRASDPTKRLRSAYQTNKAK